MNPTSVRTFKMGKKFIGVSLFILATTVIGTWAEQVDEEGFVVVESSVFDGVMYDAETQTMVLKYDNGDKVKHFDVPRNRYDDFLKSRYKGGYYKGWIKKAFSMEFMVSPTGLLVEATAEVTEEPAAEMPEPETIETPVAEAQPATEESAPAGVDEVANETKVPTTEQEAPVPVPTEKVVVEKAIDMPEPLASPPVIDPGPEPGVMENDVADDMDDLESLLESMLEEEVATEEMADPTQPEPDIEVMDDPDDMVVEDLVEEQMVEIVELEPVDQDIPETDMKASLVITEEDELDFLENILTEEEGPDTQLVPEPEGESVDALPEEGTGESIPGTIEEAMSDMVDDADLMEEILDEEADMEVEESLESVDENASLEADENEMHGFKLLASPILKDPEKSTEKQSDEPEAVSVMNEGEGSEGAPLDLEAPIGF